MLLYATWEAKPHAHCDRVKGKEGRFARSEAHVQWQESDFNPCR